jgi:hypothetical protein
VAFSSEELGFRAAFLTSSRRVGILPPSLPMISESEWRKSLQV